MRLLPLLSLVLSPLPALAQILPDAGAVLWSGSGTQPDGQTWLMQLTLLPDGALVLYPDVPCAGAWRLTDTGPTHLAATEHLAAGFDLCVDGLSLVAQTDSKGTMTVTWTNPDGTPSATATLQRD